MKLSFLVFALTLLISCSYKTVPLKGSYQTGPFVKSTTTPPEKVWDKVIDLFATKGLSIKVIDKSSGLIVSDKTGLLATNEDKNGKLINPSAWIVLPKFYNPANQQFLTPNSVTGEWNVRIKSDEKGGTLINVNLVNVRELYPDLKGFINESPSNGKSTGVFEEIIFNYIK